MLGGRLVPSLPFPTAQPLSLLPLPCPLLPSLGPRVWLGRAGQLPSKLGGSVDGWWACSERPFLQVPG